MGKITGFLEFHRQKPERRPVKLRLKDWREFEGALDGKTISEQGARCMDCGIPFCHSGCPLGNLIPDWNDFVFRDRWKQAAASTRSRRTTASCTSAALPTWTATSGKSSTWTNRNFPPTDPPRHQPFRSFN